MRWSSRYQPPLVFPFKQFSADLVDDGLRVEREKRENGVETIGIKAFLRVYSGSGSTIASSDLVDHKHRAEFRDAIIPIDICGIR